MKSAEEGVSVWVFFDEGIEDIRIQQIGDLIAKRPEVAKMDFISAQEAWESFRDEYLGEYGDGFTENPLENSANYQVYLNDVSMQSALVTYLESIDGVRMVNRSELVATTHSRSQRADCLCFRRYYCDSAGSVHFPDQQYRGDWYLRP